jgi:multidrug efflux pump subunit AcrA (membrane-fusion protein)
MPASVMVREYPGQPFAGKVTRAADSLDTSSRTMLTEVQVPNDDGALRQGMYAQVSFALKAERPSLLLDANMLSITADGARVALVRDGRIHLQPITIDSDLGSQLVVSSGVTIADAIVQNPDSRLKEGVAVEAVETKPVLAAGSAH